MNTPATKSETAVGRAYRIGCEAIARMAGSMSESFGRLARLSHVADDDLMAMLEFNVWPCMNALGDTLNEVELIDDEVADSTDEAFELVGRIVKEANPSEPVFQHSRTKRRCVNLDHLRILLRLVWLPRAKNHWLFLDHAEAQIAEKLTASCLARRSPDDGEPAYQATEKGRAVAAAMFGAAHKVIFGEEREYRA